MLRVSPEVKGDFVSSRGMEVGGVTWAKTGERRKKGMRRDFIKGEGVKGADLGEEEWDGWWRRLTQSSRAAEGGVMN